MENEKKRILIVDDDDQIREPLEISLTAGGFEVRAASNGKQGLALVREWDPDLVVLDVRMPKMNGWEVLREIRETPRTETLPVIILTGVTDEGSKVLGFRGGADDYLEKPFSILELIARVERMFERQEKLQAAGVREEHPIEKVPIRKGENVTFIPIDKIYFIEAAGKYAHVHTKAEKHLSDLSLKDLEDAISAPDEFFRIHRSYIVNLDKVKKVVKEAPEKYILVLADDKETMIYVSRRRLRRLREILHF